MHFSFNVDREWRIEAKVPNQDRWQFLALYLVRRIRFCGSSIQKILFCYSKDTFCGSLDTELVSWFWFDDPLFLFRFIPCRYIIMYTKLTLNESIRSGGCVVSRNEWDLYSLGGEWEMKAEPRGYRSRVITDKSERARRSLGNVRIGRNIPLAEPFTNVR